jgi:hypothetical protein
MLGAALGAATLSGCVERTFVVNSEPPGATVYRNNMRIGQTPADDHFLFYGDYDFTLVKDGYETLHVKQCVSAPWYEYPPLDFVSETLWPWKIRDQRRYTYQMSPVVVPRSDELLGTAQTLRTQGQALEAKPRASSVPVTAPAPATVTTGAPPAEQPTIEAPQPRVLPAPTPPKGPTPSTAPASPTSSAAPVQPTGPSASARPAS